MTASSTPAVLNWDTILAGFQLSHIAACRLHYHRHCLAVSGDRNTCICILVLLRSGAGTCTTWYHASAIGFHIPGRAKCWPKVVPSSNAGLSVLVDWKMRQGIIAGLTKYLSARKAGWPRSVGTKLSGVRQCHIVVWNGSHRLQRWSCGCNNLNT